MALDSGGDPPVIVIGAGMAGISAAHHLQTLGIKSKILEARDRIGGRIFSKEVGDKEWMEMGAQWIHGACEANPIFNLANR